MHGAHSLDPTDKEIDMILGSHRHTDDVTGHGARRPFTDAGELSPDVGRGVVRVGLTAGPSADRPGLVPRW